MARHPFSGPVAVHGSMLPPVEIRALPFDALRHQLPTQNPVQAGRALQAALMNAANPAYTPPQLLPRRLVQSRWKRAPGGRNRGGFLPAGSSVPGLTAAQEHERARQAWLATLQPVARTSIDQAAIARGQQTLRRVQGTTPVAGPARTLPRATSVPDPALLQPFELRRFVQSQERRQLQARANRAQRQTAQLESAGRKVR